MYLILPADKQFEFFYAQFEVFYALFASFTKYYCYETVSSVKINYFIQMIKLISTAKQNMHNFINTHNSDFMRYSCLIMSLVFIVICNGLFCRYWLVISFILIILNAYWLTVQNQINLYFDNLIRVKKSPLDSSRINQNPDLTFKPRDPHSPFTDRKPICLCALFDLWLSSYCKLLNQETHTALHWQEAYFLMRFVWPLA